MSYGYNYGLPPELAREYEEFAREQLLQQQQQQQLQQQQQTHTVETAGEAAAYARAPPEEPQHHHQATTTTTTKRKRSSSKKSASADNNSHELERLQNELVESKRREQELLDDLTEKVAERGAMNAKLVGVVAGRQERKSARGNRFAFAQLSDPTGAYEVTLFSDTLEAARDHLDAGCKVLVSVEATMEAEQLKLLGRSVGPVDAAVADVGGVGLKIYVESPEVIVSVATVLEDAQKAARSAGRGPVQLCLMNETLPGEVEVDLGEEYLVNPQIKGAIKSLNGVLEVEDI